MTIRSFLYFIVMLSVLWLSGCKTYTDPQTYHTYETRVLAEEPGEIYVLRVQGTGQNRGDAVKNAMITAVRDVIFKDLHLTYGNHKSLMRLVNNPSVEEKYPEVFATLFSRSGEYKNFVKQAKGESEHFSANSTQTVIINVKVNRLALRNYLKENGVL